MTNTYWRCVLCGMSNIIDHSALEHLWHKHPETNTDKIDWLKLFTHQDSIIFPEETQTK